MVRGLNSHSFLRCATVEMYAGCEGGRRAATALKWTVDYYFGCQHISGGCTSVCAPSNVGSKKLRFYMGKIVHVSPLKSGFPWDLGKVSRELGDNRGFTWNFTWERHPYNWDIQRF